MLREIIKDNVPVGDEEIKEQAKMIENLNQQFHDFERDIEEADKAIQKVWLDKGGRGMKFINGVISSKELMESGLNTVKEINFDWFNWRFDKIKSLDFLQRIRNLSNMMTLNCKGFFNAVDMVQPIVSSTMEGNWNMFKGVERSDELVKIIQSEEAFSVNKEEFVDVRYLVRDKIEKLSRSQKIEREIKWKLRTKFRMKCGK
jgi:hypothetical protein